MWINLNTLQTKKEAETKTMGRIGLPRRRRWSTAQFTSSMSSMQSSKAQRRDKRG